MLKIRSLVHMMCLSCQLSFQSLEVEESGDCTSDYVTVHRDVEGQEEIGVCPLEPRLPWFAFGPSPFGRLLPGKRRDPAPASFTALRPPLRP